MFCTRCATLNPPSAAWCGCCGARLDEQPAAGSQRNSTGRRNWPLLLPVALAIGVMVVVGWRTWTVRQEQSAAYEQALTALSAGNLPEAIAQFGQAGGYRDAQEQRVTTQQRLAPYQAALLDAQSALDQGDNQRAVTLLRSVAIAMPDNQIAGNLLAIAEERFRADLARSITIATTNRDWLEVERTTLELAFWDGASPDEDALAALRLAHAPLLFTRNGALYRIGPNLADESLIFDQTPVTAPLWSPDRSRIAFFSVIPGAERFGALFVIDADGGNPRLIDEAAILSPPAWSPDGRQLVYVAPGGADPADTRTVLRFHDLTGAPPRTLAPPVGFERLLSPSWSGEGDRLAVVATGEDGNSSLLIVDAVSLEARPLLDSPLANARAVSWSPGADVLLLWTSSGDSDWYALRGSAISLIAIDNRSILPVTTATQAPSRPVWAPDGIHFAYLDRGSTLHVRVRTGIGDRILELPNKGNGMLTWGPGGVGIMVPALDLADPSMLVPVGDRLGPVEPIAIMVDDGFQPTDFQWGPITAPDPALYDPLPSSTESANAP